MPREVVMKELKAPYSHVSTMRKDPLYLETIEEIKRDFKQKIMESPGTNELVKILNVAMGIGTKKLVHLISSSKTCNKDLISAVRLVAQMDGRFLGSAVEDEGKLSAHDAEEVAVEIRGMIQRHKESVQ